jgi:CubicO group peptidase (beta-lactamase class C family)
MSASPRPAIPPEEELQEIVQRVRFETDVPAIGVAISVGGQRSSAYAGRPSLDQDHALSDESRFEMSCLMKFFVSLVVLELAARDQLDLDAPIEEYLPELLRAGSSLPIRVRHLLSHSSGYRGVNISDADVRWAFTWRRMVDHFHRFPQSFPPGAVVNYEHTEHVMLGEIIRRVCGVPAPQLVREMLFDPLGVVPGRAAADSRQGNSYVAQHVYMPQLARFVARRIPPFAPFWAASLPDATLTLMDTLSLGECVLGAARNRGPLQFSTATVDALCQPVIAIPPQITSCARSEQIPKALGHAGGHYLHGLFGHNGSTSGQTTALRIDPHGSTVVAVGVNAWVPYARDSAVERVLALVKGERAAPLPHPTDRHEFALGELTGGFGSAEISGRYGGSYFGEVHIAPQPGGLQFGLGAEGPRQPRMRVLTAPSGRCVMDTRMPMLAGFFPDPAGNEPFLMMGVHAYKKLGQVDGDV